MLSGQPFSSCLIFFVFKVYVKSVITCEGIACASINDVQLIKKQNDIQKSFNGFHPEPIVDFMLKVPGLKEEEQSQVMRFQKL